MKYRITASIGLLLCSTLAMAETGDGMKGMMKDCDKGAAASAPMGECAMPMHKRKQTSPRGHSGKDYTPGWMLMTPNERQDFVQKMHDAKTRAECLALVDQQRTEVDARAKAAGQQLPGKPRRAACSSFPHPEAGHQH